MPVEDIKQRLLENAAKIRYSDPREIKYDSFEGLGTTQLPVDDPLIRKKEDVIRKLWAYSLHGFRPKSQWYSTVTLFQFTFIERPLSTQLKRISERYPHYEIAPTTGVSFNDKAGVCILPIAMTQIHEHRIPITQLREENFEALAETARQQGCTLIGEITGVDYRNEMLAKFYFPREFEEEREIMHHPFDSIKSHILFNTSQIVHPTNPPDQNVDVQRNYYYDKAREDSVFSLTVQYHIYWNCKNDNCPWCIDDELARAKDEELRKKTLNDLNDMNLFVQLAMQFLQALPNYDEWLGGEDDNSSDSAATSS